MNICSYPNPPAYRSGNRAAFLRPFLMILFASLSWASLSQAQTVVMQDDFRKKADSIDGLAPTMGKETWRIGYDGVISTDGTQATMETHADNQAKATYSFELAGNTIYTLKITYVFAPTKKDIGTWIGFGFGAGDDADISNSPWMMISPQTESSDEELAKGLVGLKESGNMAVPAADYSAPITLKIKWNTGTGEVQYFVKDEFQPDWTQKVPPSGSDYKVYIGGMGYCSTSKITNITLTAEPAKK